MALSALELFSFGGVDSRSNPLNMPPGRALRCQNWVPRDSGTLELRYGFTTVTMSTLSVSAFHSLMPYTLYDSGGNETPYLLMGQGTQLRLLNIATNAVTSPSVRGAALASSSRFASYLSNGKIHFGNGTDQKWFDGTTVRDNGLRSITTAEIANVVIIPGVSELTAAQASTITLTTSAGGSFPATVATGYLIYVAVFDTTLNELGPATINVGTGRITTTVNQKITVGNMPSVLGTQVKLMARTGDSTNAAYFCTNTSTAITSCTRSGTTLTVISTTHGLSTGDVVVLSGTTNFDHIYAVTVSDANTFTVSLKIEIGQNTTGSNTTGGTCKRVVAAASAAASVDILAPTQDTSFLINDANRGLAISASGLTNPGYLLYAALYNSTADGHVGNRTAFPSGAISNSSARFNLRITTLPDFSGTDSEWRVLIARTGDGGRVPYPCVDSAGNFLATVSGQTSITLWSQGALFGTGEMPTRNGVIPSGLNLLARVNDRIHGGQIGRPTVYRSASESDALTGDFVGRPEQSWAPTDIDTFPTAEGLTGVFEEDRGAFFATKNDGAIFSDLGVGWAWIGPWYGAGMAGARAHCDTPYGKYWVTGHKQLMTFEDGEPIAISDEYETALLAKIGDANLSKVEMFHLRDSSKGMDKIVIKCLDSTNAPFEVFHDFKLRDARSQEGQAYETAYSSPLTSDYIITRLRDSTGAQRIWAGASTGQLYQLESGANDAGTEFAADAIYPLNAGTERPSVPEFRLYGDGANIVVSVARRLDASPSSGFETLTAEAVSGEDGNAYYKYKQTTSKLNKGFIRLQLNSHSADGDLTLSSPPHVPLETYGRIYLGQGIVGSRQGV